jgi:hypothetical protein
MKKTQYQIIQEILNNNKDVPQNVLNEGILTAIVKGAKAIGKYARLAMQKPQPVSVKKVEPRLTKPLQPKAKKSSYNKPRVHNIETQNGKIPYIKGMGTIPSKIQGTNITPHVVTYRPGLDSLKNTYYNYLSRRFASGRMAAQMPNLMYQFFGWTFVDHLLKDFTEWDAFKLGIIDAAGNEIRKAKNSKERHAWNYMLKAVAVFRQNLYTMMPSQPRINYMLRNLKMVKESKTLDFNTKWLDNAEILMNECQPLVDQYIDNLIDGHTINNLIVEETEQETNNV